MHSALFSKAGTLSQHLNEMSVTCFHDDPTESEQKHPSRPCPYISDHSSLFWGPEVTTQGDSTPLFHAECFFSFSPVISMSEEQQILFCLNSHSPVRLSGALLGFSVLSKGPPMRLGMEPPIFWLEDFPLFHLTISINP